MYFDFSGGTTIERHAVERRLIGHEIGFEKLIFGSDTQPEKIADHIRRWDTIFDLLDVPEDCRERMWWNNGAELYGEEPVAWMKAKRAARAEAGHDHRLYERTQTGETEGAARVGERPHGIEGAAAGVSHVSIGRAAARVSVQSGGPSLTGSRARG